MSKRDAIIQAAIAEFSESSYDAASVNRIIQASGTSKGTFYHYFRDKKDLYFSIVDDIMRLKQSYYAKMMSEARCESNDFFELLKIQAKAGAAFMRENPALTQFGIRLVNESGPIHDEFASKYMPVLSDYLMDIVKAGIEAGTLSNHFPPAFTSRVVWYIMMNFYDVLFDKDNIPSPDEMESHMDFLFEFLSRGFAP